MGLISDSPAVVDSTSNHSRQPSVGLSKKRNGVPALRQLGSAISLGSLSNLNLLSEPILNDKSVRKDSKYEFNSADLEFVLKLGSGASGTVTKVIHKPTGICMARKIIKVGTTDENQEKIAKQVQRELRILKLCRSPYIVAFYGAFMHDDDISIMMEYMDRGTLETIYQSNGPVPEKYIGTIALQLLQGLIYLYDNHKIVHRDIKPGNILLSSQGLAKIADFGVSKETAETLALTFIGTQCFLAPERIREGSTCTPASDVWALGLSMMEIALAKFPFPNEAMTSYFDMMQFITQEQSPTLPKSVFSEEFEGFCRLSLEKDPKIRPHPQALMMSAFIKKAVESNYDLKDWISSLHD